MPVLYSFRLVLIVALPTHPKLLQDFKLIFEIINLWPCQKQSFAVGIIINIGLTFELSLNVRRVETITILSFTGYVDYR